MAKIVLITGATSGIGRSCAEKFAEQGYQLILTGRRHDRLQELCSALAQRYQVEVRSLCFDIRTHQEVEQAIKSLPENWKEIDILINNAGLALGLSPLHEGDIADWEQMIDTNIKGLLYMSRAIIPGMVHRKKGHIINIGSIAGKETYLKGNVYCATKHAVDSLSKAMRIELVTDNIKVTQINPGAVETEFSLVRFKGDAQTAKNVYKGFQPLSPDDVAQCVVFCANLPAHVNINDLLLMPTAQASATIFNKEQ